MLVPGVLVVVVAFVIGGVGPVQAQSPAMDAPKMGAAHTDPPRGHIRCAEGTHWSQNRYACVDDITKPEGGGAGSFSLTYPVNLANVPYPAGVVVPTDAVIFLRWSDAGIDLSCTASCDVYQYCVTTTGPACGPTSLTGGWVDKKSRVASLPVTLHSTYYWQVRTRGDQRYSKNGWSSFTVVDANTVAIAGTVLSDGGSGGLGGVTMTYTGSTSAFASGTTSTVAGGAYSIELPLGWTGTVTPDPAGCASPFTPTTNTYSNVATDRLSENYTCP
jgi:hypothetical protein